MRLKVLGFLLGLCLIPACEGARSSPPDSDGGEGSDAAGAALPSDAAIAVDAATPPDASLAADAGPADAGAGDASVEGGAPDAGGPTPAQCLEGWRMYNGACAAPVITSSYVANGCVGTTGWFVDGQNFELEQHNTGIADYGPQSFGANGNQKHWNVITPTRLCVTVYAGYKDSWVGHTIYVVNPDGKMSNSVVVEDRL